MKSSAPARVPVWAPPLLLLAGFLAHVGVLQGGWLREDVRSVRDRPAVRAGLSDVSELIAPTHDRPHQPVTQLVWGLEAAMAGASARTPANPRVHHAFGLAFHLAAALLLMLVLTRWGLRYGWLAGLIFVVHPLYAGTVASISVQGDVLALCFSLLALLGLATCGDRRTGLVAASVSALCPGLACQWRGMGAPRGATCPWPAPRGAQAGVRLPARNGRVDRARPAGPLVARW